MPWPKGMKFSADHVAKRSASLIARGTRRKKPKLIDGREYWRCGTCKVFRISEEFYEDGKTASGLSSVCRACHNLCTILTRDPDNRRRINTEYMRRARKADPEKFRSRERKSAHKKRHQYPEKVAARIAVNAALRRGELVKPSCCESCGEAKKLCGHHDDYSKPLSVRWLCYGCHGAKHRLIEFKRVK